MSKTRLETVVRMKQLDLTRNQDIQQLEYYDGSACEICYGTGLTLKLFIKIEAKILPFYQADPIVALSMRNEHEKFRGSTMYPSVVVVHLLLAQEFPPLTNKLVDVSKVTA